MQAARGASALRVWGHMARRKKHYANMLTSASRASGQYGILNADDADDLVFFVNITVAGTTMALDLQASFDGGTTWGTLVANLFTGLNATGCFVKGVTAPVGSLLRLNQVSTLNFTYTVDVELSRRGDMM